MTMPRIIAVALLATFATSNAAAQQWDPQQSGARHGEPCKEAYRQNSLWPAQYIPAARCGINAAFATMVNNGWQRHNLMGPYHFNHETNALTESGRLKAAWTLTQAPPNRRVLTVQSARDQADTAERIEAVQEFTSTYAAGGIPVEVKESQLREIGHPAAIVDANFVGFRKHQKPPVLPEPTSVNGSGN